MYNIKSKFDIETNLLKTKYKKLNQVIIKYIMYIIIIVYLVYSVSYYHFVDEHLNLFYFYFLSIN